MIKHSEFLPLLENSFIAHNNNFDKRSRSVITNLLGSEKCPLLTAIELCFDNNRKLDKYIETLSIKAKTVLNLQQ